MADPARCRQRYGKRGELICRRLAGHRGRHAPQLTVRELARVLQGEASDG